MAKLKKLMLKPANHVFHQHVLQIKKWDLAGSCYTIVGLCFYTIDQSAINANDNSICMLQNQGPCIHVLCTNTRNAQISYLRRFDMFCKLLHYLPFKDGIRSALTNLSYLVEVTFSFEMKIYIEYYMDYQILNNPFIFYPF